MLFVGTFELSIDTKNRLSVPFAIRAKLSPETDGRSFYVLPGRRPGTLAVYPDRYFEQLEQATPVDEDLSDDTFSWRQFEYSQTVLVDPDGQGRLLIPEWLRERAGMSREVVLLGVRDHMELWDRDAFDAFQNGQWTEFPERRPRAKRELKQLQQTAISAAVTQRSSPSASSETSADA